VDRLLVEHASASAPTLHIGVWLGVWLLGLMIAISPQIENIATGKRGIGVWHDPLPGH